MTFLPDDTVRHLRGVADLPDLSGTRYRMVDFVARGGMGAVYLARDTELDREVALKVLGAGDVGSDVAARLMKEAKILAHLEHPGIVPVHDVGTLTDGRVFYTMKFVRGQRLDEHARSLEGEAALTDTLNVFMRVCEAVAFAHSHGVIHRDLKPANIMVGAFGEVLVLDWGVAKTLGEASSMTPAPAEPAPAPPPGVDTHADTVAAPGAATHPGTVMGTPGYMAPEQARGDVDHIDRRTDVYALGAILRELIGHAVPGGFDAAPKRLRAIAGRALEDQPAQRYQTAEILSRDVARFMAGMTVSAYDEGPLDRIRRVASRHRVPIALILAYLLMRMLLFIFTRT